MIPREVDRSELLSKDGTGVRVIEVNRSAKRETVQKADVNPEETDDILSWMSTAVRAAQDQSACDEHESSFRLILLDQYLIDRDTSPWRWNRGHSKELFDKLSDLLGLDYWAAPTSTWGSLFFVHHTEGTNLGGSKTGFVCDWKYRLCCFDTVDAAWVFSPKANITLAVVRFESQGRTSHEMTSNIVESMLGFDGSLIIPVFFGLSIAKSILEGLQSRVEPALDSLSGLIYKTGYHQGDSKPELSGEALSVLTKSTLSSAGSLLTHGSLLASLTEFVRYMVTENARFRTGVHVEWPTSQQIVCKTADRMGVMLEKELGAYQRTISGWQQRGSLLIQGMQNVITQKDQAATLAIAEESKRIAEASWKDTTSVTAITTITMIFLPASFTAVSRRRLPASSIRLSDIAVGRLYSRPIS
jgi:hypothetical protein